MSLMIHALPPQATSAVYSHIRGENRSPRDKNHAQQAFGDAIGQSFDAAVARFSFPVWMLHLLRKARDSIIRLLSALWDRLF
ncbi:ATP synthase [Escherichia coli]|nr:ATP synthase [Escherichia coli]